MGGEGGLAFSRDATEAYMSFFGRDIRASWSLGLNAPDIRTITCGAFKSLVRNSEFGQFQHIDIHMD